MKKAIIIVVSLALIGFIGYTLYANKQEMAEEAKLSEITSDAIPVNVGHPELKALNKAVSASSTFEAKTDLTLLSETQGKLVQVLKEKGDFVQKGELLAQVENEVLQAQVEAAKAAYEKLKTDHTRFAKLSKEEAVTQRQLEEIEINLVNAESQYKSAKKQLENTYIRATASGQINDDFIQEGEYISPGQKLYEIVDAKTITLNVQLTANEVLQVHIGDTISMTSDVYPKVSFSGKVKSIATKADPSLKYNVEIELTNTKAHPLKPGMYATAHFDFKAQTQQLYISRNALIGSIQNAEVYTINDSTAHLKKLTVGEVRGDIIEVLDGLDTNDQVVLTGQINLSEGTKVSVIQ
tara:strand:+ start:181 stop:1236 length:1056 start_codon:yes stop_codon:yes gene_type:complete